MIVHPSSCSNVIQNSREREIKRTATRSCRTQKRALHVYSPGVAATGVVVWPAAAAAAAATAATAALQQLILLL